MFFVGNHIQLAITDDHQVPSNNQSSGFSSFSNNLKSKAKETTAVAGYIPPAHTFFGCLGIKGNPLHPNQAPHWAKLQK